MTASGPGGATAAGPVLHRPVTGLVETCRVAWWWTRAFCGRSVGRNWLVRAAWRAWGPLAWPGYWFLSLLLIGVWGSSVVRLGRAAGHVPNPVRPGRADRPLPAVLVPAAVGVMVLAVVAGLVDLRLILVAAALLVLAVVRMLPFLTSDQALHRQREVFVAHLGRPVTIGDTFGAWPTDSKHGGPLLNSILAELAHDRVGLIVAAGSDRLVTTYCNRGGRVRDKASSPRIVSWTPGSTGPPPP